MYQKEQPKHTAKTGPIAFRGSFLMSPRVPIFQKDSGAYFPGVPNSAQTAQKTDKKNYVLFSRN